MYNILLSMISIADNIKNNNIKLSYIKRRPAMKSQP